MSLDHAAEVAPGDVARDDDLPLHVLAQDHVRPFLAPHVRQQPQRHRRRRRRVDRQVGDPLEVGAARRVELHHEVERRAPIEDPADRAPESRLDGLRHVIHRSP